MSIAKHWNKSKSHVGLAAYPTNSVREQLRLTSRCGHPLAKNPCRFRQSQLLVFDAAIAGHTSEVECSVKLVQDNVFLVVMERLFRLFGLRYRVPIQSASNLMVSQCMTPRGPVFSRRDPLCSQNVLRNALHDHNSAQIASGSHGNAGQKVHHHESRPGNEVPKPIDPECASKLTRRESVASIALANALCAGIAIPCLNQV